MNDSLEMGSRVARTTGILKTEEGKACPVPILRSLGVSPHPHLYPPV